MIVQIASEFLRTHYSPAIRALNAAGREGRMSLFSLPEKRSFSSRNVNKLVTQAADWAHDRGAIYFHLHIHALPRGESFRRGRCERVVAAIALSVDIDAAGPLRKKIKLCPTEQDVQWLIEEFRRRYVPLQAGIVIDSGYGRYPIVLFDEPFMIGSGADRDLLELLSRRLHQAFALIAEERGWTDAVDYCDLAKVLRLPGTLNLKDPNDPKLVRIIDENPTRFSIDQLGRLLPRLSTAKFNFKTERPVPAALVETAAADDSSEKTATKRDHYSTLRYEPWQVAKYYAARVPELQQTDTKQWRGRCPLHKGNKKSFVVNSENGLWYCFADCKRGGSIHDLEMILSGVSFPKAARQVARILATS